MGMALLAAAACAVPAYATWARVAKEGNMKVD